MEESSKTKQTLVQEPVSLTGRILELEQSAPPREPLLRELRASELKYRQLVEKARDQIMCMDLDDIIRYANRAACDLAGPLDLTGLPMRVFISPDQLERHEELLQRRREGDFTDYSFEWSGSSSPPE